MKSIPTLILMLIIPFFIFSQTKLDSLKNIYKKEKTDASKINYLIHVIQSARVIQKFFINISMN